MLELKISLSDHLSVRCVPWPRGGPKEELDPQGLIMGKEVGTLTSHKLRMSWALHVGAHTKEIVEDLRWSWVHVSIGKIWRGWGTLNSRKWLDLIG